MELDMRELRGWIEAQGNFSCRPCRGLFTTNSTKLPGCSPLVWQNHAHEYFTNKCITVEISGSAPSSSAANLSIPKFWWIRLLLTWHISAQDSSLMSNKKSPRSIQSTTTAIERMSSPEKSIRYSSRNTENQTLQKGVNWAPKWKLTNPTTGHILEPSNCFGSFLLFSLWNWD